MRGLLYTLRILSEIALRNLLASRWKTAIVGGIIGFGALLVVIGASLLNTVDRSMQRSITSSIAGQIQVYSAASKDELQLLGTMGGETANLAPLDDFAQVQRVLTSVPNVAAVVPMGVSSGLVSWGNTIEQVLAALRVTSGERQRGDPAPELERRYAAQKAHARQILIVLRHEFENVAQVSGRTLAGELAAIDRAASEAFWREFDRDPFAQLEFLENKIAPLTADAEMVLLRYVGTDPAAFAKAFDRMRIVDGTAIPAGKRGFLFSKYVYEDQIKLKAARGLDKLKTGIDERHATIAGDPELQRIVRENVNGVRELLLQLDAIKTQSFRDKLQSFLRSSESDVGKLLSLFFATDDANFHERYRYFYAALAPELELYRVRIGDALTINALSQTGYPRSAKLTVYGTYTFLGLEKSPQAGVTNMMDLVSFRDLYGFMTEDRKRELEAMRAAAGATDVSRENAEAELFGDRPAQPAQASATLRDLRPSETRARFADYDPAQLQQGIVLNSAVLLHDDGRTDETVQAIERAGKLAGLPLKAAPWQKATGILGQFATLMRAVLFAAVLIIFVVALVVINNALVMATLERVREIGTLRAIGAQRRFLLAMLVLESLAIGTTSGAFGAALGGLILLVLGKVGIPAASDVMSFFFAGPRLFPAFGPQELVFALATVLAVSLASGIYPAWLAMRVSPREAMHAED